MGVLSTRTVLPVLSARAVRAVLGDRHPIARARAVHDRGRGQDEARDAGVLGRVDHGARAALVKASHRLALRRRCGIYAGGEVDDDLDAPVREDGGEAPPGVRRGDVDVRAHDRRAVGEPDRQRRALAVAARVGGCMIDDDNASIGVVASELAAQRATHEAGAADDGDGAKGDQGTCCDDEQLLRGCALALALALGALIEG